MEDDDINYHKIMKDDAEPAIFTCSHQTEPNQHSYLDSGSNLNLCREVSLSRTKKRAGRWLLSEHYLYIYAVLKYGTDWRKVKRYVKSRSVIQIRSHSQKYLLRLEKRKNDPLLDEDYRCKTKYIILYLKHLAKAIQVILTYLQKQAFI